METKLTELQLKLQPFQKRIQGLLHDKYLLWIESKTGHIEKNVKPISKCQHYVFDHIFYVVMDYELHGSNKSPNIDYSFMKKEIGKIDQLKEAFSSGKAQIFQNSSGWKDDMKFLYHLIHIFLHFFENQNRKLFL